MSTATVLKHKTRDEHLETGLTDAYRTKMSASLSDILADTYRLTIKSHVYHWNVVGPLFRSIHELTEEHYGALFAATDIIAERIRALGHIAPVKPGSAANFAPKAGDIAELSADAMVHDLISDHEAAVRAIRSAAEKAGNAGDVVTEDMLTARSAFHEKAIWMLRAIVAK